MLYVKNKFRDVLVILHLILLNYVVILVFITGLKKGLRLFFVNSNSSGGHMGPIHTQNLLLIGYTLTHGPTCRKGYLVCVPLACLGREGHAAFWFLLCANSGSAHVGKEVGWRTLWSFKKFN